MCCGATHDRRCESLPFQIPATSLLFFAKNQRVVQLCGPWGRGSSPPRSFSFSNAFLTFLRAVSFPLFQLFSSFNCQQAPLETSFPSMFRPQLLTVRATFSCPSRPAFPPPLTWTAKGYRRRTASLEHPLFSRLSVRLQD